MGSAAAERLVKKAHDEDGREDIPTSGSSEWRSVSDESNECREVRYISYDNGQNVRWKIDGLQILIH